MLKYGITTLRSGLVVASVLIFAVIGLTSAETEDPSLDNVTSTSYVPNLAGKWYLDLMDDDSIFKHGDLALHQAEKVVFGGGNITTQNVTREVVAGGFLEGDALDLYLISKEADFMLRLEFTVIDGDLISGYYRGYSSDAKETRASGWGIMSGHTVAYFEIDPPDKARFGPIPPPPPPGLLGPKPDKPKPNGNSGTGGSSSTNSDSS